MKTIPLSDAYAKATKGPLKIGQGLRLEQSSKHGNGRIVADMSHDPYEGMPGETRKYDAFLLCHAFNVLPTVVELLEADGSFKELEEWSEKHGVPLRGKSYKDIRRNAIDDCLTKASNVPMPE